jgi:hypothetical protein
MDFLRIMAVLIEYPLLALVPAMLFLCLFAVSNARLILVTGMAWFAYVPYEYGMKLRLLCSGECNIRVDLLAIYLLLIALSVAGLVVFAVRTRKRDQTGASN